MAAEIRHRFRDDVVFVDLAPLSDPELITPVAMAVGISIGEGLGARSMMDLLVDCLALRHCLFVIDNCEHLLDAAAELIDRILARCPQIVFLRPAESRWGSRTNRRIACHR